MEFWAAEVESGASCDVKLREGEIFHITQVCLGEVKERNESASLYMTVDGRKLLFGILNRERCPQLVFDLVFKHNDLQVSHNRKSGSVFFYGYKNACRGYFDDSTSDDSSSEDEVTGKAEAKKEEKAVVAAKQDVNVSSSASGKQKLKIVELEKDVKESDDDDSDDYDAISEDSDDDEDNEDSSDDEEQEETPKKSGKKRVNEYASKTPTNKKAKVATTPQKTEGKKGGAVHIATRRPSKWRLLRSRIRKCRASEGSHSCK